MSGYQALKGELGPPPTGGSACGSSTDRAKVQAMRDANWTPASTYWRLRAEAAEQAREMAVCQAFSAGYEAGQRHAQPRIGETE